jgi:hypothetical protein
MQGQIGVVCALVVFNLVNNAGMVIECSAMSCEGGVRIEVRYEHVTTGGADTTQFSVCRKGIAEMA